MIWIWVVCYIFHFIFKDLINVIMSTAQELVNAERCALFLIDKDKEELWSRVARGASEIRFPMRLGIAGHVATTGETLNIPDGKIILIKPF